MKKRTKIVLGVVATLVLGLAGARAARHAKWERWVAMQEANFQQARLRQAAASVENQEPSQQHAAHQHHAAANSAMSGQPHQHMEKHMRWTAPRTESPEDLTRANEIVATLRSSLDRYKDYKAAVADGYEPFLPDLDLPMYHFTNYRRSIAAAFSFDPEKPSSLLYRKHATGYELIGVMYTAPRRFSEEELHKRVPLSIARWHQHVNICLPSGSAIERAQADWTRFGPAGSIATESECKEANGRWQPVLFGWMVHVYPFEETREKIWTH